jgi:uncharacterized protein YecT (DUF1311 family)
MNILVLILLLIAYDSSYAVSFNCDKAKIVAEFIVCADEHLSRLDDKLSDIYTSALQSSTVPAQKIISDELAWLTYTRNPCKTYACTESAYISRIKELSDLIPSPAVDRQFIKDGNTGCAVFNPYPKPGESVTWSGICEFGKASGYGVLKWYFDGKQTDTYIGVYKHGKASGYGVYYMANGDKYDGEWKDDMKNGRGVLTTASGDKYDGEWKDDKANGRGVLSYADGEKYDGEWKDNKKNGRGVLSYASGEKYVGEWKDNKKNGRGVFSEPNGAKYDGEWKDDMKNGWGVLSYADGAKYDGEWKDSKKNGRGVLSYANGAKYDGEWKDDKKVGDVTTETKQKSIIDSVGDSCNEHPIICIGIAVVGARALLKSSSSSTDSNSSSSYAPVSSSTVENLRRLDQEREMKKQTQLLEDIRKKQKKDCLKREDAMIGLMGLSTC